MQTRYSMLQAAGLALAATAVCAVLDAQTGIAPVNGTVTDATGNILVRRGAGSFQAARGTSLQAGDQIFLLDGSSLTFACPGQDAVRVTTVGTFTYSGCDPSAVAAVPPPPAAAPAGAGAAQAAAAAPAQGGAAASSVTGGSATTASTSAAATPTRHVGAVTLGVLGGLAVLAAAAGGGGGGGSTSPPASPP